VVAATYNLLSVLIFMGCIASKPTHTPQFHQAEKTDQDSCLYKCKLSAQTSCVGHKWIRVVVPCEIMCKMHVA
jgi:hypothetical protein